jgi:bifunctional DNA-binding transcriptional regulator/antitoxin component of YhaV-PrlF toxin-antitoxin module
MTVTTKIYENYQTAVPSVIRKKLNIGKNDLVEWSVNKKGAIEVRFRKKVAWEDIEGKGKLDYKTNSVELKKELYK